MATANCLLLLSTGLLAGAIFAQAAAAETPDPVIRTTAPALSRISSGIGVFYSFDHQPFPGVLAEMQAELQRIMSPSGLALTWRPMDGNRGNETFPEVLVIRFRGFCDATGDMAIRRPVEPGIHELAETLRSDGKILPFGEVLCDQLGHYLAPSISREREAVQRNLLGKAMARVVAHEIFHMLTGSAEHSKQGIARASHSRRELTAERFDFDQTDAEWLRAWRNRSLGVTDTIGPADNASSASGDVGTEVLR